MAYEMTMSTNIVPGDTIICDNQDCNVINVVPGFRQNKPIILFVYADAPRGTVMWLSLEPDHALMRRTVEEQRSTREEPRR